jgi:choline dehydrogenase-like flavoprotein
MAQAEISQPSYAFREEVDFVIVGSGAAGGIMAKELSVAGFSVVVLEQGPHLKAADFKHDEWGYDVNLELAWGARQGHPQTFRQSASEEAELRETVLGYAHNVGGSTVHFSGNFWRFRPIDFNERPYCGYQFCRLAHQLCGSRALLYKGRLGSGCVRAGWALGPAAITRLSLSTDANKIFRCLVRTGCEADGLYTVPGTGGNFIPAP